MSEIEAAKSVVPRAPFANGPGARKRERPLLAGRVPLAGGMENGIEPPDELVHDVILRARVHWVYAAAGSAKTWLALWIVERCIETGMRVAYFDAENGDRIITERLVALGTSTERLDDLLYYFPFPISPPKREWCASTALCSMRLVLTSSCSIR